MVPLPVRGRDGDPERGVVLPHLSAGFPEQLVDQEESQKVKDEFLVIEKARNLNQLKKHQV